MVRTAGSWLVIGGLLGAVTWLGCRPDSGTPTPVGPAELADVLAAVGPDVVVPALEAFRADATSLQAAIDAWETALGTPGEADARQAARDAWRDAMLAWQVLEPMQIGPAGSSLTAVGGADVRDAIYSWPTTNPCRVDQETVDEEWGDADFFAANLVNSYGLDAIEHLLHAGPANACPGQVDINANGTWTALGPAGVEANRASFASALAADVLRLTDRLLGDWQSGAFALAAPPFESDQEALNAVYDALFYLEKMGKDRKLAEPVGLGACTTRCDELVEHRASGLSIEALRSNLEGFRWLFTGGEGPGMDALLDTIGQRALAEQILAEVEAADAALAGVSGPLDAVVTSDPARGEALHAAMKALTDLVKGDLATALALRIPAEGAGDND